MQSKQKDVIELLESVIQTLHTRSAQNLTNIEKESIRQQLVRSYDLLFHTADDTYESIQPTQEETIKKESIPETVVVDVPKQIVEEVKEEAPLEDITPIEEVAQVEDNLSIVGGKMELEDDSASLNEKFTAEKTTLADKINRPQGLLKNSIDVNEKFFFIKELFKSDANAYEKVIRFLDNLNGLDEAFIYIEKEVAVTHKWENISRARDKFMKAVTLRFTR